jgi:3-oxoacyl-[acyl-carrier-protein] synthase II
MMERVVITGAGAISPIGNTFDEVMQGIGTGQKGIGEICCFNTEYFPSRLGAEVKEGSNAFKTGPETDRKEVFIRRAMAELFEKCRWIETYSPLSRILILGAGLDYFDLPNYVSSGNSRNGNWLKYSKNTFKIVESLAARYEIGGGFTVNVTACVASTQALGLSFRMLKNLSRGKIIIGGGFDSMLNHLHYMGFYKLGALSDWRGLPEEACRPFDKQRCGLVLGEGAVVFLLQNAEDVEKKHILAEISGFDSTMDAYMVTDPAPGGEALAKAAINAINEAGITPVEIDCVHLHGTGTLKNEIAEYKAIKLLFPKRFHEIPVFSMKGAIGHLIGACGSMEMIGVIYSLQNQTVPPTVNFKAADPDVPLRIIKDEPLSMEINYILKLNSAFGGQNTALVVKRYA